MQDKDDSKVDLITTTKFRVFLFTLIIYVQNNFSRFFNSKVKSVY